MSASKILSWPEARIRLRKVLEKFLEDPPPTAANILASDDQHADTQNLLSQAIRHNIDLYFGSTLMAASLFAIACLSVFDREAGGDLLNAAASRSVYRFDVLAASILLLGAIVSLWLVQRSTSLRLSDREIAKQRDILRFLKVTKRPDECEADESHLSMSLGDLPSLSGTALTDLYPVYRSLGVGSESTARWVRIPSLLLVEGDVVALQVGDVVPANCSFVEIPAIRLTRGERVSLDSFGETEADVLGDLPLGRTTLSSQSESLLSLCNRIRLVRLLETPLNEFLRRPAVLCKSSQAWRKLQSIRGVFFVLAAVLLVVTAAILLVRPGVGESDLSLILSLPFLAALGVSPVVGPVFVFLIEVVGTARILATVHPFANPESEQEDENRRFPKSRLLFRYLVATSLSRLSLWSVVDLFQRCFPGRWDRRKKNNSRLVRVPPATLSLLEKLGVSTAFALVDDELACEASAIPQQLLIPSRNGLKLLDLCPTYDDEESVGSDNDAESITGRPRGRQTEDSDSDSEAGEGSVRFHSSLHRKFLKRRALKRRRQKRRKNEVGCDDASSQSDDSEFEVQFEDPRWWQHLPSLKCIGLSCMLVDDSKPIEQTLNPDVPINTEREGLDLARRSLINVLCCERRSYQLQALAECIGFSSEPNSFGSKGDISPFSEKLRVQVLSKYLFRERLSIDAHERSSEQARWWGLIRPDSTSVIVKDSRSGGYQLLTVGDPQVVAKLCNEAWQGEISTILPLGADDRKTILESSRAWKLADLDVAAFSYSPVPQNLEKRLQEGTLKSPVYLLDHSTPRSPALLKDKSVSAEWSLIRNQIFLGMLGSLVVPRREIQSLLDTLNEAGVRFVYFSPRNMRRQKELASQMGIDVAWNCAISLRPLESGESDPHRMVSNYADWTVNAKLPHGVEDVRKHLEDVDNVPLLVSLYTDVTKTTTKDMVNIFQDYSDTVIAVGLSHLPRNDGIFSTADIAVGIDVLSDGEPAVSLKTGSDKSNGSSPTVIDAELELASAISSHACAFRFRGASSISHLSAIIEQGRASLQAATAAVVFFLSSSLSLSLFVLFATCTPATTLPHIPVMGVVIFLQVVLPSMGLSIAFSDNSPGTMKQVPSKNDTKITFGRREGFMMYQAVVLKSILPSILCQPLHLVVFGELLLSFEPELVLAKCGSPDGWHDVIRCNALKDYYGPARTSSGVFVLGVFVLLNIVVSVTYIDRFESILQNPPWKRNDTWIPLACFLSAATVVVTAMAVHEKTAAALPWYVYILAIALSVVCIVWNEHWKKVEARVVTRSEKLRRLQFETRLGAWSPK